MTGRKRHLLVDTDGLPVGFAVTAASVGGRAGPAALEVPVGRRRIRRRSVRMALQVPPAALGLCAPARKRCWVHPCGDAALGRNERDAAYVLDGLLYHESELAPEEHYTDTHGYTECNFAAFAMLGRRFCPRIRGLKSQRIYHADSDRNYGPLAAILARPRRRLRLAWIEAHWDQIARLVGSFAYGHTTASVVMQRLVGFGAKNHLYRAMRELGRLFKTEFILEYLARPDLRRRVRQGLLKSEELHAMARSVFYGKLGRADWRDFHRQMSSASCLVLVLAAIIYWQIREIQRAIEEADDTELNGLRLDLLTHVSPIGWENVVLYGEYVLHPGLVRT